MICPRCGREISDTETLCPYCMQIIDHNVEINDYRKDGFLQIQVKNEEDTSAAINYTPKYFEVSEFQIFVIAIVFILIVSAFTLFSLKFVQKTNPEYNKDYNEPEIVTLPPETEPETETQPETIRNDVKNLSIDNLIGGWRYIDDIESPDYAIPYITFAEDNIAQQNYGSMTKVGKYKDVSTKHRKLVYIAIENVLKGRFEYNVTGNSKDGYTLTLKNTVDDSVYTLVSATAKTSVLKPDENAKLDRNLFGYWLSEDKKSYKFYRNGTLVRYTDGTTTQAVWAVDEPGILTIKYRKDVIKTINVEYFFSDDLVVINGTEYAKQNRSAKTE